MKLLAIVIGLIVLFYTDSYSQFPFIGNVDSKGATLLSPNTVISSKYKVIVEGTFSIWPQFQDCRGFDACYVYEVPQEEIDALRWPPEEIVILGNKIEILKLPKYVGDSTLYQIPPPQIATPIFEMSMKKQKGFRINGEPIPFFEFDSLNHRYEFSIIGDGKPLIFQIIDSNYSIQENKFIPRFEDNCGFIKVTVIEINPKDSIITEHICDHYFSQKPSNTYHIDLNIFYKKNFDEEISNIITDGAKISLSFDGQTFLPFNIECDYNREPSNILYLLDNSGSMLAGAKREDTIQRIDQAKQLIVESLSLLNNQDYVSLFSFNDKTVNQSDWISVTNSNIDNFKYKLNNLEAGYRTDLLSAFNSCKMFFDSTTGNNKVLMILSDFADNYNKNFSEDIIKNFNNSDINTLLINYALGGNETDQESNIFIARLADGLKRTTIFNSDKISEIKRKFYELTGVISDTNCCDVMFDIDPCHFGKDTSITSILSVQYKDSIYKFQHEMEFKCNKSLNMNSDEILIQHTFNSNLVNVTILSKNQGYAKLTINDLIGNLLFDKILFVNSGLNYYTVNLDTIGNGLSLMNIYFQEKICSYKLIK